MKTKLMKRKSLIINFVLMTALLFSLISSTNSWFIFNRNIDVQSGTDSNIAVAVDSGNLEVSYQYSSGTELVWSEYGAAYSITSDNVTYYIDITGDGKNFLYPQNLYTDDKPVTTSFIDISENEDGLYYITLKLKFRSTRKMDIYLTDSSSVAGPDQPLVGRDIDQYARSSFYGAFSRDAIAGASRVAFLTDETDDDEENYTVKCLWVPNDTYCLSYIDGSSNEATLSILDTQYSESLTGYTYYYFDADDELQTYKYTSDDYANGNIFVDETRLAIDETTINNAVPIISFENDGELNEATLIVNIWFEGTDREADKALNGGMVNYSLSFVGITKDEPGTLTVISEATQMPENEYGIYYDKTSHILKYCDSSETTLKSAASIFSYSTDGINWSVYNNETITFSDTIQCVYIRLTETEKYKPGNVVKITNN